jgi:hypothetical protein
MNVGCGGLGVEKVEEVEELKLNSDLTTQTEPVSLPSLWQRPGRQLGPHPYSMQVNPTYNQSATKP